MRTVELKVPKGFGNVLASQIVEAASSSINITLQATKSYWEQIAQQTLHTTRADYIMGLNANDSVVIEDFTGTLTLIGKWPCMLEEGYTAFDEKEGFKKSKYAKPKKNGKGWYLTIPFRHRVPGTAGSAVGGQAMPDDIYAQAKQLRAGERLTGTETAYPPQVSWKGYQHKSGIYENMTKYSKTYDKATQNKYFTFRRVSDKSEPNSWWHPSYPGVHAIDKVESRIDDLVSLAELCENACSALRDSDVRIVATAAAGNERAHASETTS
jgi:hypothetical protein